MSKLAAIALVVTALAAAGVAGVRTNHSGKATHATSQATHVAGADTPPSYLPKILKEPSGNDAAADSKVMMDAARTAWHFVDQGYSPQTGLTVALTTWAYPTVWDIASGLAAYYSAHELGFITKDDFHQRVTATLKTLSQVRLYNGIAYGRNYDARTGELVGNDQKPSTNGTGYSATDVGRLLVWLRIVSQDPALAGLASTVAKRIDATRLIRNGYMHGETVTKEGQTLKFQEGRIGYEQYAAAGFNLWGMRADRAARASSNGKRITSDGVPITTDKRKLDRLTSEPLILYGMELGFTNEMREIAWQTLALQAQRYTRTGIVTIASEDALNHAPHYFYYYCVYCSGQEFVINVHNPGTTLMEPRWVSTKAAFAWHALMPSKYTWMAVNRVMPAHDPKVGWASGVWEKDGKSTETFSLNTAAVILEAALYQKTGKPFLKN